LSLNVWHLIIEDLRKVLNDPSEIILVEARKHEIDWYIS